MKKLLSIILSFSLFLSACSTLTDIASESLDKAANAAGVDGRVTSAAKKAVIPGQKSWDDGEDISIYYDNARADSSQKYMESVMLDLMSYLDRSVQYPYTIAVLKTARVQGVMMYTMDIRISRGMVNMIYDEAELACLMGHEMGHTVLSHEQSKEKKVVEKGDIYTVTDKAADIILSDSKYKDKVKRQQRNLLRTNWSRDAEKAADKYGAELAAKAGYDPYAFCDLFERLAERVDLGLMYRFQKIEGSHPALDDRAKSLREYLQKKGYIEGVGKRNRQEYLSGMSEVHAMRTGEGKKEDKKIQKEIDAEGKKDLKRLDEIFKEVEGLKKANKTLSMKRFIEIMDEVSVICKKYGVTAEDVFGGKGTIGNGSSFMEESLEQDSPFWEMFKSAKEAVAGKVGGILNVLGHMAVGAIPVVGDVVDLYELFVGKDDIFTGEKLSAAERALTALGLLVGSGASWRSVAKGIEKEALQMGLNGVKKSLDDAVTKAEKSISKTNPKYPDVPIQGKVKAEEMVDYLNKNKGQPPRNVRGKGIFENNGKNGSAIIPSKEGDTFLEYDISAKNGNRGKERIVVNEKTGEVWYTKDHYLSFEKLDQIFKPKK